MNTSEAIKFANRFVSTKLLEKTKFWSGSLAEFEHRYGGIRLASIDRMIKEFKLVEGEVGLDEDEKEFLKALQETWDNELIKYYERIV